MDGSDSGPDANDDWHDLVVTYCDLCDMNLAYCVHGRPAPPPVDTLENAKERFNQLGQVDPERADRVQELKADFLRTNPEPQPDVAAYWTTYQDVFSREGLHTCARHLLKDFANSNVGASPGNMAVFNSAWNEMGEAEAAHRVRNSIDHLLYGPGELADRLTALLADRDGSGMPGFKEALLTRVLCIMAPDTILPILIYTSPAGGKKEIAKAVWGLDLPARDATSMTIGRLIVWSNDILIRLAGDGFAHMQHLSQFYWETKDRLD